MTDVKIDDLQDLVDEYADRMREICKEGQEQGFAHLFCEALTDLDSRGSNARRLQKVTAVNRAATVVRTERRLSPAGDGRTGGAVNPQVSRDSDSARRGQTGDRGEGVRS